MTKTKQNKCLEVSTGTKIIEWNAKYLFGLDFLHIKLMSKSRLCTFLSKTILNKGSFVKSHKEVLGEHPGLHWCIKSIHNGFAIVIDCTLKVVPFDFFSVQVMSLSRICFWLLRRSNQNFTCSGLRLFLGFRHIWG